MARPLLSLFLGDIPGGPVAAQHIAGIVSHQFSFEIISRVGQDYQKHIFMYICILGNIKHNSESEELRLDPEQCAQWTKLN